MVKKKNITDTEKEKVTTKTISPFDIIDMMFKDYESFNDLPKNVLEKNFFIINRTFAIKYPQQAAVFNKLNINTAATIKFWAMFLVNKEGYGKLPYFVFTKGNKKTTVSKNKDNIDKDLIKQYCIRFHITLKDYETLKSMFNEELINDVKRYEKLISIKEQEKTISK